MLLPIAYRIRVQAGAMSFDRLAYRRGMGRKEERREMDELRRQWKLCPQIIPAFEPALRRLLIGRSSIICTCQNRCAQRQAGTHKETSTSNVVHTNLQVKTDGLLSCLSGKVDKKRP